MKSFRSLLLVLGVLASLGHAELAQWVQHLTAGSPLESIFFRTVTLPSGPVQSRRPPRETVAELAKQIATEPTRADLHSLRAQEAELNLDFEIATQEWKEYARLSSNKSEGSIALADYYHRRLQPDEELTALLEAARQPAAGGDALQPETEQRSWRMLSRAIELAQTQALPVQSIESIYNTWMERYPAQPHPYTQFVEYLVAQKQPERARQQIARYAKAFPKDDAFPLRAQASLAIPDEALKLYEQAFRPVVSPGFASQYFQLLKDTRNLRVFLANARAAVAANPNDLAPAAKLFYYYQQQGNLVQAHRALLEYRQRRTQPTAEELLALATLFEQTNNYSEAARHFQELSRVEGAAAEQGLAGLIRVLFTAPEQPLPVVGGDISFYKDIATMDPYPGTLNGILSLLFNSTDPRYRYADQQRSAIPYFHRALAAELLQDMEKRFPQSAHLPDLQAQLLQAYSIHGENDEVIKRGQQFLSAHPSSPKLTTVWLSIADAHARMNRTAQEFAVYDALLKELAANAQNVPLGSASDEIPNANDGSYRPPRRPQPARSARYAEVLDRYVNRLVSLKRVNDALALYRREIDRNPADPGLYERLAEFLNQNKLAAQIEQVYVKAAQQFQEPSWNHKLARWYLRQKQMAAFEKLTRSIAGTFSGTELDTYFQQVVASANLDAALYRQVNLYAHQRFPHDLVFVKNLLNAYSRKGTEDEAAAMALLRQHWYHDGELRSPFFERLASTGKLQAEIAAIQSASAEVRADRAAAEFIAGAEIWRSHFEAATPVIQTVAASYPAHQELNTVTSSLLRSLGETEKAAEVAARLERSRPRDLGALIVVGEIYADRGAFDKARSYWNRLPAIEPGSVEGYREAATVFWDYYLYDDALRTIAEARAKLGKPALLSYEAGAIHENQRDYAAAIREYVKGALEETDSPSRRQLVRLAARPAHRNAIEAQTQALASGANPNLNAWNLRVALLEEQSRRDDIASLLSTTAATATNFDLLARVEQVAGVNGFAAIREQSLARQSALTPDPVERTRLRLMLARLAEDRKDSNSARQSIETAYRDNQNIAGVVRATVDYYWRSGDRKRAIDTLEQAAGRSNAAFKRSFILEAGRKSTEAGDYQRARSLLGPLLTSEPLAPDMVAVVTDTYARAGDDNGLRSFYADRLKLAKTPEQQSAMRRGLIPVLTRMKEYAAAVDEYIGILNRFPEDEAITREASQYARKHNVTDRLTAFYEKAITDSPRDARWPMILARVRSSLEDLPAALQNYSSALAIRPDRTDLWTSRAALEERLFRFDDAIKSYTRLYQLAYKDPQYMVKAAEAHARLGRKEPAIQSLRLALIEGKAAKADAYLEIAGKLEQWGWLTEARQYAADARKMEPEAGVALEARIAARLREYASLTGDDAARSAAQAASEFYTPEEKTAFAAWLTNVPLADKVSIATSAGLPDVAVKDLNARLTADPKLALTGEVQRLIGLQQSRLQHAEVAAQLEAYWKALPPGDQRDFLLTQASDNWRIAGNASEELRSRQLLFQAGKVADANRYADLLFTLAPERFVQAAAGNNAELHNATMALAYQVDDPALAFRIIERQGARQTPVWSRAYTALTGLYFHRSDASITAAFQEVLGPRTIGEQLTAKPQRDQQAIGETWFYYAARLGESGNSEEYLPAEIESRPASAEPYMALGDYYRDAKVPARALEEYTRSLQIDPNSPEIHNRIAELYSGQNKTAEAQEHWRQALRLWGEIQDRRVPDTFWAGVSRTIEGAGQSLRPEIDKLLRTYIRRNGNYQFQALLDAIWKASPSPAAAAQWVTDLSSAVAIPSEFLASIVNSEIITDKEREFLYGKVLDAARREAETRTGDRRNDSMWRLQEYNIRYIRALMATRQYSKASEVLQAMPREKDEAPNGGIVQVEIELAAATDRLDAILARDDIQSYQLMQAASSLRLNGDAAASRRLLEWMYTRELDNNNLDASNFLGLAEVRLELNNAAGAVTLLRRMTLVTGEPFELLTPAAELLERFNRNAEAVEFREARAKASPWDHDAAVKLAIAKKDTAALKSLASNPHVRYVSRIEAAQSLPGATGLGSEELDLLASSAPVNPTAAEKPYFYHSRIKAAGQVQDLEIRIQLLRGAIAIDPSDPAPKLNLFRAHFAANQFEQAVGVFRDGIPATEPAVRNALARDLAAAYRKLGDLEQAQRYLKPLDAKAEIAAIDAELKRREQNRTRMPHVHDGIDQTQRVRPRI